MYDMYVCKTQANHLSDIYVDDTRSTQGEQEYLRHRLMISMICMCVYRRHMTNTGVDMMSCLQFLTPPAAVFPSEFSRTQMPK
jgi:hypothetical protein